MKHSNDSGPLDSGPLDPMGFRSDFPILGQTLHDGVPLVYFDNAASTQRPRQVIQAMSDVYERYYANVHRGIHWLSNETTELFENARDKVTRFLNAPCSDQIVFTSGTTAGINLVARTWGDANVGKGDQIVVTEMEHHSNLIPWLQLAERTGAIVRHIPLTDDGRLRLDTLDEILSKPTRLVAVTAVSNVLGTINPIDQIITRAHQADALVLVDAAQSVPHLKTDVIASDVDFLAFSGHKMTGPSAIGVLYGKRDLLESMPPFLGGGEMVRQGRVQIDCFEPGNIPARFEAGTPPIVPAIGLGAAIDYLDQLDLSAVHEHELRLTQRTHEVLESIGGIRILGPEPEQKGGIVTFTTDFAQPFDIAEPLDHYGIAIRVGYHCAEPVHRRYGITGSSRVSFYFYNTLEEVERFGEAMQKTKRLFG